MRELERKERKRMEKWEECSTKGLREGETERERGRERGSEREREREREGVGDVVVRGRGVCAVLTKNTPQ